VIFRLYEKHKRKGGRSGKNRKCVLGQKGKNLLDKKLYMTSERSNWQLVRLTETLRRGGIRSRKKLRVVSQAHGGKGDGKQERPERRLEKAEKVLRLLPGKREQNQIYVLPPLVNSREGGEAKLKPGRRGRLGKTKNHITWPLQLHIQEGKLRGGGGNTTQRLQKEKEKREAQILKLANSAHCLKI